MPDIATPDLHERLAVAFSDMNQHRPFSREALAHVIDQAVAFGAEPAPEVKIEPELPPVDEPKPEEAKPEGEAA